jgi:hypothetical protein
MYGRLKGIRRKPEILTKPPDRTGGSLHFFRRLDADPTRRVER